MSIKSNKKANPDYYFLFALEAKELIELLEKLKEYFDNKADCDYIQNDIDFIPVPNKEMKLLSKIDEVLQKIKK